ncbi:MAG: TetR/AcrR family transcriptional regulator [Segniliparus sp.]|uniref:TetR/AcrR family transcriptional regulator n=1 Tax=Segniliparus sp. TaxID=2804064 RepID=UPI003F31034F
MAARDRLVRSAISLIRRKGVAGTGLTDLTEHSGHSRRTIYLNFPRGKAELVEAATRAAGETMGDIMAAAAASDDPAEIVSALVQWWSGSLARTGHTAGCPVAAAALARPEAPGATEAAASVFSAWIQILASRFERAGVGPDTALRLATTVITAIEGAIVVSVAGGSSAPLEQTGASLVELVARHIPPPPDPNRPIAAASAPPPRSAMSSRSRSASPRSA